MSGRTFSDVAVYIIINDQTPRLLSSSVFCITVALSKPIFLALSSYWREAIIYHTAISSREFNNLFNFNVALEVTLEDLEFPLNMQQWALKYNPTIRFEV